MLFDFKYKIPVLLSLMLFFSFCSNEQRDKHALHRQVSEAVYTCPMHPEIRSNVPGSCPVCGMALVKKDADASNIQRIEIDALLKPTNQFVISGIPVTTMQRSTKEIELDVLGNVAYDTRQIGTVSSRASGRIEKLYIRYKYQRVKKGQKLMDIYSPELVTAQQNLLFLIANDAANTSLIDAAQHRLLLLGLTKQQVKDIMTSKRPTYSVSVYSNYSGYVTDLKTNNPGPRDMNAGQSAGQQLSLKEGMYLQKGQSAFTIYNADKSWILLNIFPEQQAFFKIGNPVSFVPETSPGSIFHAKVDYIEPVFREGSKTLTARLYFDNRSLILPVGSRVKATIFANAKDACWLPRESVLSLGREKLVFVKEAGGFRAKQITTGLIADDFIELVKGLSAQDSVAVNAHYLVDNESFIQLK
jgi:membrane fusion protein, copper/silver efflux system